MHDLKTYLSRKHEEDWAEYLGTERNRGSGNVWNRQLDGRQLGRLSRVFAFAFDCKAAMPGTQSIPVTRKMLEKLLEQTHSERPLLPLRFYDTERGGYFQDWVVVRTVDFLELLEKAESS
jgi:hypothetical protein